MNSRDLLASTTQKLGLQVRATIPDFTWALVIKIQIPCLNSKHFTGWAISPSTNPKLFEYQNDVTSEKSQTWLYIVGEQTCQKYYTELPLGYVHKIHVRYKWILCLDLGPISKDISLWICRYSKIWQNPSIPGLKHGRWRILNLSMLSQRDLHFNGVRMKTASRCTLSPGISVMKGGERGTLGWGEHLDWPGLTTPVVPWVTLRVSPWQLVALP